MYRLWGRRVNTIIITCNASSQDVVQAIKNNPEILEQEDQEGQYILKKANLEVAEGVTFEMTSNGVVDNLQYLKIAGANGIIVHGKIHISDIIITSWDTESDSPVSQTDTGSVTGAFINLGGSEGGFIQDSEIAYLDTQNLLGGESI